MKKIMLTLLFASLYAAGSSAAPGVIRRATEAAPGRYLVLLDPGFPAGVHAARIARETAVRFGHVYETVFNGFALYGSEEDALRISRRPEVLSVSEATPVRLFATQYNAPAGLDRIDQYYLPLDTVYNHNIEDGSGVRVYVIDTGVYWHSDFGNRYLSGESFNFWTDRDGRRIPTFLGDCDGHGTQVMSIVGGAVSGVAKSVWLINLKAYCNGGNSLDIIAAIDHVTAQKRANPGWRVIANMSLGGPRDPGIDNAALAAVAEGVTFVVAAGNGTEPASSYSPGWLGGSTDGLITVGSTVTTTDHVRSDSAYGPSLDLFAPGETTAASYYDSARYIPFFGTSAAAPHVAGVAAWHLANSTAPYPWNIENQVKASSHSGVIGAAATNSPDRLLGRLVRRRP